MSETAYLAHIRLGNELVAQASSQSLATSTRACMCVRFYPKATYEGKMFTGLISRIATSFQILCLFTSMALLIITACVGNASDMQIETPLNEDMHSSDAGRFEIFLPIATKNPADKPIETLSKRLAEYEWTLFAIYHHGESKEIFALEPTYFLFDLDDNNLKINIPCEGMAEDRLGLWTGFIIISESDQRYEWQGRDNLAVGCGDTIDAQREHLRLADTNRYEIENDQLFLIGEEIKVVLKRGDATMPLWEGG